MLTLVKQEGNTTTSTQVLPNRTDEASPLPVREHVATMQSAPPMLADLAATAPMNVQAPLLTRGAANALNAQVAPSSRVAVNAPPPYAVKANVSYQFHAVRDAAGLWSPTELGQGKFAKVFRGTQQSAGQDVRPVAIKVLHDFARIADERLFRQEIELLKEMTAESGVNVVRTIDIIHLEPMVMCGCGHVYHPMCPRGCNVQLARRDNPTDNHPSLHCSACNYELSGRYINEHFGELLRYPAKRCCQHGPTAKSGRIINFVDREAIVMELLEVNLVDFVGRRRNDIQALCGHFNQPWSDIKERAQRGDSWFGRARTWLEDVWQQDQNHVLLHKTILLEKVRLMVELAEAVSWLHGDRKIVHKDLAPDNLMISFIGSERDEKSSVIVGNFQDALNDMISSPRFHIRVIDFGLSDKNELTRSWYEDEISGGSVKHPFLSPEACRNRFRIGQQIMFDGGRFRVPKPLATELMETDILADARDQEHNHDIEILRIEKDPANSDFIAYYRGQPSPNAQNQQFELVRRLGEAHDLYAVGALFYFILVEQQRDVEALGKFVGSLEDVPLPLTPDALAKNTNYLKRRNAIPEKFWQDELMVVILRAMVRGRPESLKTSRIARDATAAALLLRETKRIYHGIQQEILSAPSVARLQRTLVVGAAAAFGVMLCMLVALLFAISRPPATPPTTSGGAPTASGLSVPAPTASPKTTGEASSPTPRAQ